jgi:hypothetical protein
VVHKDVLSQADILIAMKLTALAILAGSSA